jgi:hypothetical protein
MNFLGILSLFDPGWWRAWGAVLGLRKLHMLTVVKTDRENFLKNVRASGNFGFGVTHNINPQFFQKGIDGATEHWAAHAFFLIGKDIAEKARKADPTIMNERESPRWKKYSGYPVPRIGGVDARANDYEVVEAKIKMSVTDMLRDILNNDEQVVLFTPQNWTEAQKVAMALEAYSWVGEPYDVPEIGNYVLFLSPNSKSSKCCSTLVAQIIRAGDDAIVTWCKNHKVDFERIPPRDIFVFGMDMNYPYLCWQCAMKDALAAKP